MRKRFRYEWILLASSALFYLMSRFVIPRYEEMMNLFEEEEVAPLSEYSLILAVVLFGLFLVRVILVIRRKPEE